MTRVFFSIIILLTTTYLGAQEIEVPLIYNADQFENYKSQKSGDSQTRSVVSLPFREDFSQNNFPGNPNGNPVLWESTAAYLNQTFAVNPPTIGIVSFDGLDETGFPYDYDCPNCYGPADTLTSTEIDLSNNAGNLVMSFFIQGEGRGNKPELPDSLVLQFYAPDSAAWYHAWSTPGIGVDDFEMILLPINDALYQHPQFRFRFINYATQSGALDHWHLDYIELDDNRSLEDTIIQEIAYVNPQYTLLNEYSSVPWDHFDPDLMRDNIVLDGINNDDDGAFLSGNLFEVAYDGTLQGSFPNSNEPSVGAGNEFVYSHSIGGAPNNYSYDASIPEDEVTFDVHFEFTVSPDEILSNNELDFSQSFSNYYAYDDGTAERGYGVDAPGGQVAYRFDFAQSDSLAGVDLYFLPVAEDPSDGTIFITVWSHNENTNEPDTIIYQDELFSYVDYGDELNEFITYPLESKIFVDESSPIWVGWTQTDDLSLNVGNDKNTNNNETRLMYNVTGSWFNSIIEGSLMIRPIVGEIIVTDISEIPKLEDQIILYPNPTSDQINLKLPFEDQQWSFELYDLSGSHLPYSKTADQTISLLGLPEGLYWIRLRHPYLSAPISKKFVIVR